LDDGRTTVEIRSPSLGDFQIQMEWVSIFRTQQPQKNAVLKLSTSKRTKFFSKLSLPFISKLNLLHVKNSPLAKQLIHTPSANVIQHNETHIFSPKN
jgi:hypothetical protein